MADDPLFILIAVVMIGVVLILVTGVAGFARGGEFNRKYANKLMRWRIAAQFLAVVLILFFVWVRG